MGKYEDESSAFSDWPSNMITAPLVTYWGLRLTVHTLTGGDIYEVEPKEEVVFLVS